MIKPISITALASVSALGTGLETAWENYLSPHHFLTKNEGSTFCEWVAKLQDKDKQYIEALRLSNTKYKKLDDSVLYAIFVSRQAVKQANWGSNASFGVNFGSSRGATRLFENYHKLFLEHQKAETLTSPTTTLGNISSWVAHDLQCTGPEISHSITCSTALHSVLNGVAWIASGLTNAFLVGGSEAPLTPFTIAQMKALKVYTKASDGAYPCRAFDFEKEKNTMVLGEGASAMCLEKGHKNNRLATIAGIGYATEVLEHNTSISAEGHCFQKALLMALGDTPLTDIDAIVMHAPGTVKGDMAEYKAIKTVFGAHIPFLTTNKWKIGHTFATSGMLSLELAVLMLQHQKAIAVPFAKHQKLPKTLNKILVNAVGFGGNAVSVLLTK